MPPYLDLLQEILDHGAAKGDRTGTGTRSLFGRQLRYDLAEGFPVLTTKKLHLKSIIHELLWFLKGDTNVAYLRQHGVKIWDAWPTPTANSARSTASSGGPSPPPTVATWIRSPTWSPRCVTTPTAGVIWSARGTPARSTRWPCRPATASFSSTWPTARSAASCTSARPTSFWACPSTSASYALLTRMLAQVSGLRPGDFVHTFGDVHLYNNHVEQAKEQLTREPRALPTMKLNPAVADLFAFTYDDFELVGYDPWPAIRAPVAV